VSSAALDILIVDDDSGHAAMLETVLSDWGYATRTAADGEMAVAAVRESPVDAVLMDVRMAGMGGIEALKCIKEYNPAVPVLIMTAYAAVDTAVEALKNGAYDYLTKPLDFDVLQKALERAVDHAKLKKENEVLRSITRPGFEDIIASSPAMRDVLDMAAAVADSDATVLIFGESGTGKELIARALHSGSPRKEGPLVVVNATALAENLLESELFGHEKGAFTGADKKREGRFVQAHGGSLFLDEIGDISAAMQAKLLRALQEKEIQPVGGNKTIRVDVRIIAATNRDLQEMVRQGTFREDLFYRLNVVTIDMPPLRERREDIALLADHFLSKYAQKNRKNLRGFTPQAMDALLKYPWPGNVRELENAVERAVILAVGEFIDLKVLPAPLRKDEAACPESGMLLQEGLGGRTLEDVEREAVSSAMQESRGNKSEAAEKLGITRATLYKKLKKYCLDNAG
jgi:two-component system response regulator HydG